MKRVILIAFSALISVGLSFAETDSKALDIIQDIQQGRNNNNAIEDLYVKDDATVAGDLAVTGTITGTGASTLAAASTVGTKKIVTTASTTADMLQYGNVVNGGQTTYTQTFATVYTSVPKVFLQPTVAAAITNGIVPVVLSNQFTVVVGAATNFSWLAIGPKP